MKTALFFFLLGATAGVIGRGLYLDRHTQTSTTLSGDAQAAAVRAADQTKAVAGSVKDSIAAKLRDWHLTPDEIKADLAQTGRVVREKSAAVGDSLSDARILSVIKAKYVLDGDLAAFAINVDVQDRSVTLHGRVKSADLIGKAIALALDTTGVTTVTSNLTVEES